MALITKEIRLKSEKCKNMVDIVVDKLDTLRRGKNIGNEYFKMNKQIEFVAKGLTLIAPYQNHFKKIYGMSPYEYTWKELHRWK